MQIKVDFTLRAVTRKNQQPRYDLVVILKNTKAEQKVFGKNYSNLELIPAKPLEMGDYQLICNERGLGDLIQNSKGFRINGANAEAAIGNYADTGDPYYFVRVELCSGLSRTCYLTDSQVQCLKFIDLGFQFTKSDNQEPIVE